MIKFPGIRKMCVTACAAVMLLTYVACDTTDDERIPAYPVQIMLNNTGLWHTYGVAGFGESREFIRQNRVPSNFQFLESTYTGYGGVLLIMGMNPFSAGDVIPLAYDLSCPVECKEYIRVHIDPESLEAVCSSCGSHYDVTMSGGSPVAGPTLTGSVKYALQRYSVFPSGGGYVITR
ncbi:MAG: hypothetical protein NC402_04855 [Prevotella sp.]|nr:hypothetical protein [Prevotella sp.]MCM1074998.1 hypothetical protein [Ruminococcus sp.]